LLGTATGDFMGILYINKSLIFYIKSVIYYKIFKSRVYILTKKYNAPKLRLETSNMKSEN
jgi:hypothetical protein